MGGLCSTERQSDYVDTDSIMMGECGESARISEMLQRKSHIWLQMYEPQVDCAQCHQMSLV